jgi:VWFA-related protein
VEVMAVVRDSQGREVPGLTRSEFELLDEGKPREVTEFSVQEAAGTATPTAALPVNETPAPAATPLARPRVRTIALLFDDLNSAAPDFLQMRNAALHFVKQGLAPGDRVGVFSMSRGQVLPFTSDAAQLTDAIAKLSPVLRPGRTTECPYLTPYIAYVIANNLDNQALAAKVSEMQSCSGGAAPSMGRGRGQGGKQTQGLAPTVIRLARMVWEEQEVTSRDTLGTIESLVEHLASQPGQRLLLLGSGGFLAGTLDFEQQNLIEAAVRADVVIDSLDAKGIYTADLPPIVGGTGRAASAYAARLGTKDKDASNDVMENLSASTGGRFFRDSNDLAAGFSLLTQLPGVSYLLGFSAPEPDGKFHSLKVHVPGGKGYTIQARLGYMSQKETPRQERKIDREVFTSGQSQDAPVGIDLTAEPSATGGTVLRAVFHADVRTLPFVEQAGVRSEKLSFILAFLDKDGNFISGKEGAMEFALKQSTFDRLQGTRLDANLQLEMPPAGTYRLRVLIEEANAGKMTEATKPVQVK